MTDVLTLPFPARPSDPQTSQQAAAIERSQLRAHIRSVLAEHPEGVTDWELTELAGFDRSQKPTVGKRRQECGAIDTGIRRPSPTGSSCIVWSL